MVVFPADVPQRGLFIDFVKLGHDVLMPLV